MDQVLIFKTNAKTQAHIREIGLLFKPIGRIKEWSVDLEDCDRILRVVAFNTHHQAIEGLLKTIGIECKQMACFEHSL